MSLYNYTSALGNTYSSYNNYRATHTDATRADWRTFKRGARSHGTAQLNKTGQTTTNYLGAVGSIAGTFSNMNGSLSEEASSAREGMRSAIGQFGPWGAAIAAASGVVDSITDATGISWTTIDKDDASRAGVGKGVVAANNILASIPGNSIWGAFLKKTNTAQKSALVDSMSGSYGGSVQDINSAVDMSGKRAFGAGKMNQFIAEQNRANNLITNIAMQSELAKNNNIAELYQQQNFNRYSGHSPNLLLAKKGTKIPELEVARDLLKSIYSKPIESFANGGKLEVNVIPEGALHKNKHHLEEINPELEGTITEKGIPVITEDGEQRAEIECGELILNAQNTKIVEEYKKQYETSENDNILIECGKFLVQQILKNTTDTEKVIKNTNET